MTKIKSTNYYEVANPEHPVMEALIQVYGAELTNDLKGNSIKFGGEARVLRTVALYREYPLNGSTIYLIAWNKGLLVFNSTHKAFEQIFRVPLDYLAAEIILLGKPDSLDELIAVLPMVRNVL